MVLIYGLFTDQLCWYVGSTKRPLNRRLGDHQRKESHASRDIPEDYEWEMRVLEECALEQRYTQERHWYDTLKPFLNVKTPNKSNAEAVRDWRARNRERFNENARVYQRKKRAEKLTPT